MRFLSLLLLLAVLTGCEPSCTTCGCNVVGVDEFVIDSYRIRQGKLAIHEMEGRCIGELPCDAMEEYEDVITEDDVLNIVLYHPTRQDLMESIEMINEKGGGFRVHKGLAHFPDIPPVYVEGLTLEQAKAKMEEEFHKEIQHVQVFITYKSRLRSKIDLIGLVNQHTLPVDGKMRLYEAVSKAKISPEANLYMSYVVRDGKQLPIDLHKLVHHGELDQDIVMREGDKVFIAKGNDARVTVMGEVGVPTAVSLPYGAISLREALVEARGIPFTGDKQCIQVIRGNIPCPKIYLLSWCHIINLPNESLLLMPGDTVYVSEKPITKWNRFIDQLLPSFAGVGTVNAAYRVFGGSGVN